MRVNGTKDAAMAGLVLIIIGLLMPFAYIWAWNTLFGVVYFIETNFWTWLATALFTGIFTVRRVK